MLNIISKIEYIYRDSENYKEFGYFFVSGKFILENILDVLFDSEFFVPENIGIPSLAPVAKMPYDHFLHEFSSVEIVKDGIISMSSIELIRRIETANKRGWFYGIY